MIEIDSIGWNIFLLLAVAIILYFIWRFLNETKRIQEKMKGMKSFADIIDATNQALDEFNSAFEEAGQVIEKRRVQLEGLITKAENAIERLEAIAANLPEQPAGRGEHLDITLPFEPEPEQAAESEVEKVEEIKKHLAEGKSHEEISRITGASIREVSLVEKFTGGR